MKYKLIDISEIREKEYEGHEYLSDWDEYGAGLYVWDEALDMPTRLIAMDGGEPEDQTFYRDWSWVPQALEDAYRRGHQDGWTKGRGE